jgi:peptidoglycan/LPS O-acetylase OafA/YrhL
VLSVVIYHLDPTWMPGGFVGVDIFFVISGFVVAHSVIGRAPGSFGSYVAAFYKRRFQRILPVAFLYIAVAALLSLMFIPLAPATKFLEATGAASVFAVSNVILYLKSGDYFASSSELNLFTHTWSLAIEEQYYLFFPFFSYPLLVGARTRKAKAVLALFVLVCLASFASSVVLSARAPTFAFYMLPTRFWELGLGFLLRVALGGAKTESFADCTRGLAPLLAAVASLALVVSLIVTDPLHFPFPGAVLPCFATALLIAVVWCYPDVWIDRLLSLRLPVWLGNISYSLYLWHWGVIVLMRWTIGIETLPLRLAALSMMLMLSYLSYNYVENTFHNREQRNRPPSARFFLSYAAAAVLVACICAASFLGKPVVGFSAANQIAIWDPYVRPPLPADCPVGKQTRSLGAGKVITFAAPCAEPEAPHLFILGDSHAGAYQRAAWRIAGMGNYRVTLLTLGGCRPILLSKLPDIRGCPAFLNAAAATIRGAAKPGDVLFLPGLQTTRYRKPDGVALDARPLDPQSIAASRARLNVFAKLGPAVIVEGAKPVAYVELYRCSDWFNRANPECQPTRTASASETFRRVEIADSGVAQVAAGIPVTVWSPRPQLCTSTGCPAFIDGKPLYFDSDHLSAYANDRLLGSLLAAVDVAHRDAAAASRH